MKERDVQRVFKTVNQLEGVFELKLLKVKENGAFPPLPFDAVRPHQKEALLHCCDGTGLYHKISDSFIGDKFGERRFPSPKPFDCFLLKNVPAYVVVCYYIPRQLKRFYYIPAKAFLQEERTATRKSLTYDRIVELSVERI